jgi:hypothetical protein
MAAENQQSLSTEMTMFLVSEFTALRTEILKRIELQHQLLSLTLVVFGTILSFGLQVHSSSIVLLYPILAFFLSSSWTYHGRAVRDIVVYIRNQIEAKILGDNLGWEHRPARRFKLPGRLDLLAARGIFAGTSALATLVAVPLAKLDVTNILLFATALVSIVSSITILRFLPIPKAEKVSSILANQATKDEAAKA